MSLTLESLNLASAEKIMCEEALRSGGSIVEAAILLGITRHALKRRILKHRIEWPTPRIPASYLDPMVRVGGTH